MIYLDNAATTFPKPPEVYSAVEHAMRESLGNPGRAGHRLAREAEQIIAEARWRLARLINAESQERVVFTLNGTDSLNIALKGCLSAGDHVVTGVLEHNSVRRPLSRLAEQGIELTIVDCDDEGYYRPSDVKAALRPTTKLVALTHASNVLGTVQPIAEIAAIGREHGALVLVDAAQTLGAWPIDVQAMNIDLLAGPAHKSLFAPAGLGVLYVGPRAKLKSWREGGTGRDSASELQPGDLPFALESGTPNVIAIAGLRAGLKYLDTRGVAEIQKHGTQWAHRLLDRLANLPGLEIIPTSASGPRVPIVSFRMSGMSPDEVGAILDASFDLAVRTGLLCAPFAHRRFGTFDEGGTVRVSGSALSSDSDADALIQAIQQITG